MAHASRTDSANEILTSMVKAAIDQDLSLQTFLLSVQAHGGRVTLQGVVDVLGEKVRAEEIARGVEGVIDITNALTMSTDGAITDKDVLFEVLEELEADPDIDLSEMGAVVTGGTAILTGWVPSPEYEHIAIEVASRARGVTRVVSKLRARTDGDGPVRYVPIEEPQPEGFRLED